MSINRQQLNLFDSEETKNHIFKTVKKIPYKFYYIFKTEDGKKRTIMVEDWELGMLYWRSLEASNGDEEKACQLVKNRYFTEFKEKKDIYFFMGTTLKWHDRGPNPFIIIGVFYPPKTKSQQLNLNFD